MKKQPLRSRVKAFQKKAADSMVDIDAFRNFTCARCKKDMGPLGVKGVSVQLNAQHLGDIVVELQCPHCSSGYYSHYRRAAHGISYFAKMLLAMSLADGLKLPKPVNSFNILPEDNNLVAMMGESSKQRKPPSL